MARARPVPGLGADTRFGDAAAAAVRVRTAEVFAHSGAALDLGDIEGVHDMRVATRRLRAALEVFASCFPKSDHRTLLGEVKDLADTLGRRRDPDVAIAELEAIAGRLTPSERPGIDGLVAELRSAQLAAQDALAQKLDRVTEDDLQGRLERLAEAARA